MSAQRMALKQPESFAFSAAAEKEIDMWVAKYPADRQRSALIPALWIAQKDAGGWLPEVTMRTVADKLGMAYIRVYEVATFYTMYNLAPVGEHFIQLCGTTPCWLRGSDDLKAVMQRRVGGQNTISADGKLSWLEVECLGACSNAPMIQISNADGDHYYEDLTAESFDALLDKLVAGEKPAQGPQNTRHASEPEGGATVLIEASIYKQGRKLTKLPNQVKKLEIVRHAGSAKAAPVKSAKPKAATKPTPKAVETAKPKAQPAAKPAPKVLYTDGPTDGTPDDLKVIKGIGPVFERELNEKGIYYYRQIGAWKAADVKMVEAEALSRFPGRIKRDEWVKQAKVLAKSAAKAG
jgi:NADH-quinone oxidoreductase subunit E